MFQNHRPRNELLNATDETIEDALKHADPMALRGLLYQLTGDASVSATRAELAKRGFNRFPEVMLEADQELLRRRAGAYLRDLRDTAPTAVTFGPAERLPTSLRLATGLELTELEIGLGTEELGLDPWARTLKWRREPESSSKERFRVLVVGAGMAGLTMGIQLKRAGIPFRIVEKNPDVGGTWHANNYPGARVDTPSRGYTGLFGVDFEQQYPYAPWSVNNEYFRWLAKTFDLYDDIAFETEVKSLEWDDTDRHWKAVLAGPDGFESATATAVVTAVGVMSRPKVPDIAGMSDFKGQMWHTAEWPQGFDTAGKRFAVIGTGCTGYQLAPELALDAEHVAVFQRTPQWVLGVRGYSSPAPEQVNWLDRNFPYYKNFMRVRATLAMYSVSELSEIDSDFADPDAPNAKNKRIRNAAVELLEQKLGDPELVSAMLPPHPLLSARPVNVDVEYSILDALGRPNVELVTSGIRRITETGIEDVDGNLHEVDVIAFATGFHANDYLFPMRVAGREGVTVEDLWRESGARAYRGSMVPGFPNLWMMYGPNTNGGVLPAGLHELTGLFALQCMERLLLDEKCEVEVTEEAYEEYNREVDEGNRRKVWSDPRADSYFFINSYGRSAVNTPFWPGQIWKLLREPEYADLRFR